MERIGNEIQRNLKRTGSSQLAELAEITSAWPLAVGAVIARNAWPLRVSRDGTLQVATSSSTWAFELQRMSREIGERMTSAIGENAPSKFRFRPGLVPDHGAEERPPEQQRVLQITSEAADLADAAAAEIADRDLRELVVRAARASLSEPPVDPGSDRGFW